MISAEIYAQWDIFVILDPGLTTPRLVVLALDFVPILQFSILLAAFYKIRSNKGPGNTLFGLSYGKVL